MRVGKLALSSAVATCLASAAPNAMAQQVTGAGSTFVNPVMSRWSAEYGIRPGEMRLTGELLADTHLGKVRRWNAPGEGAYPITATTFVVMPRRPSDRGRSKAATDFLAWPLRGGQESARDLGYVALPPSLVTRVEAYAASAIPGR